MGLAVTMMSMGTSLTLEVLFSFAAVCCIVNCAGYSEHGMNVHSNPLICFGYKDLLCLPMVTLSDFSGPELFGLTTDAQDFRGVMKRPGLVALGTGLQYTIMPSMGFLVARLGGLSRPLAVGYRLLPTPDFSVDITWLARDPAASLLAAT